MKFSLKWGYFLSHWLNSCQILSSMYSCDLDSIMKFIVLYDGYPLNEQMAFLQVCIDISKRLAKAGRL